MPDTDVEDLRHKLRQLHGFDLREEQIQAIKTLAIDREDLILIARTGWGKSIIFQSLPAIRQGIVLMIMPLNLLEEEQVGIQFRRDRIARHSTNLFARPS